MIECLFYQIVLLGSTRLADNICVSERKLLHVDHHWVLPQSTKVLQHEFAWTVFDHQIQKLSRICDVQEGKRRFSYRHFQFDRVRIVLPRATSLIFMVVGTVQSETRFLHGQHRIIFWTSQVWHSLPFNVSGSVRSR